mgnify:CR=1 FL=1
MIIEFHLAGENRKKLAWAVAMIIGTTAEYQYMHLCLQIGECYTVTKSGNLEISDQATVRKQNGFLPNWRIRAMLFRTHQNWNLKA